MRAIFRFFSFEKSLSSQKSNWEMPQCSESEGSAETHYYYIPWHWVPLLLLAFLLQWKMMHIRETEMVKTEGNHEKDCLTLSSCGWGSEELKTGQECLLFSQALEFGLVSVQGKIISLKEKYKETVRLHFVSLSRSRNIVKGSDSPRRSTWKKLITRSMKYAGSLFTHIPAASALCSGVSAKRPFQFYGSCIQ